MAKARSRGEPEPAAVAPLSRGRYTIPMALDFTVKDVMHKIIARFAPSTLPGARKPYTLKAVLQPELDIHEIASKAEIYNIETDPKVIEEGFTAAAELILRLAADGYRIKTSLFSTRVRFPGEYDGDETALPDGVRPEIRLRPAGYFREFINAHCAVQIDGVENENGRIAGAVDMRTGLVNEAAAVGGLLTIRGRGLKIAADSGHAAQTGVFFVPADGAPLKAELIAVNENRTLRLIVPALTPGAGYALRIRTMSAVRGNGHILKYLREMTSDFTLTAR